MSDFLARIERFLAARPDLSAAALGRLSVGDPAFVRTVRLGRSPRLCTALKVLAWMDAQA